MFSSLILSYIDDDCRLTPLLLPSTSMKSDHQSDDVTVYSTRIPVSLSLLSSGPSSLDENYKSNDYSILLHTGHFIERKFKWTWIKVDYIQGILSSKINNPFVYRFYGFYFMIQSAF